MIIFEINKPNTSNQLPPRVTRVAPGPASDAPTRPRSRVTRTLVRRPKRTQARPATARCHSHQLEPTAIQSFVSALICHPWVDHQTSSPPLTNDYVVRDHQYETDVVSITLELLKVNSNVRNSRSGLSKFQPI